jgi:hypothetical protein
VDRPSRHAVTPPDFDYYVQLALDAQGDKLTPALADEIRQIARSAINYKFQLTPSEETQLAHARFVLRIQGRRLFGDPPHEIHWAIEAIDDPFLLDIMLEQLVSAPSWAKLLDTIAPGRTVADLDLRRVDSGPVGVAKAREEQARAMLLLQGRHRFGEPTAELDNALKAIGDLDRLNGMAVRLLTVSTWDELLEMK